MKNRSARGSFSRQKRLGAFYTPEPVARSLVRWALDGRRTPLLDPSFGGCVFLTTGLDELSRLGVRNAPALVFGIDIDPRTTRRHAEKLVGLGVPASNFIYRDFLDLTPESLNGSGAFGAVVGNPPY